MPWKPGQSGNPAAQFKPGQSGNPSGRPRRARQMMAMLESRKEELIQTAIDLALGGDIRAIQICLDRLLPADRHEYVTVDIPEGAPLAEQVGRVLKAVADGSISVEAGSSMVTAIKAATEIEHGAELYQLLREFKDNQKETTPWTSTSRRSF